MTDAGGHDEEPTRAHGPQDIDRVLLEVERLRDDIAQVRLDVFVEVERERHTVAALTSAVTALSAAMDVVKPRVWWWPDLTEDEARDAWAALTAWLRDVLAARYVETDRVLTPCWYHHPAAVDALTVLYATWRAAYQNPAAEPVAAAHWLKDWLPTGIEQLKKALQSCDRREHRDDDARAHDIGRLFDAGLAAHIAGDLAARHDGQQT
ncbi:MAG: hypothetical protein H0X35_04355 [Pseudonocardiales bacterium]|nr:hypothetical protein [Pseudonocardiales bacterium]